MTPTIPDAPPPRRRASRVLFVLALAFTIIGVAPLVSAGIASAIASHAGCALDEGTAHSCIIAGRDMGGLLYTMGVAAWLSLLTIWLLLIAPILWIAALVTWSNERRGEMR